MRRASNILLVQKVIVVCGEVVFEERHLAAAGRKDYRVVYRVYPISYVLIDRVSGYLKWGRE